MNRSYKDLENTNYYLEEENSRLKRDDEERREREYQANLRRRQQMEQEREESLQMAGNWTEAFSNSIVLFSREARLEARDNEQYRESETWEEQTYFQDTLAALKRGQELYRLAMKEIEESVRLKVAEQLSAEFPKSDVVTALKTNNYDSLLSI